MQLPDFYYLKYYAYFTTDKIIVKPMFSYSFKGIEHLPPPSQN
jgi:hypothetical protein